MFKKFYPKNNREIFTSPFRQVDKHKQDTRMSVSEETNEKQKRHPTELQIDLPPSKRNKYQK